MIVPEHVERSFLDPEYSFAEYFQLGSRRNIRPVKNGLKGKIMYYVTDRVYVALFSFLLHVILNE